MNKTVERLAILALGLLCTWIVWAQLTSWANAQTSIPGPGSATISVTTANGALESTQRTIHVDLGAPGDTVCATDSGTCNLAQLVKRTNARITSFMALLPTSLGAGGGLKTEPLGPNASCASYKSTLFTAAAASASKDLGATGNVKWAGWQNVSRSYRIIITDPGSNNIMLAPNGGSIQFSVENNATPDNTTASCPDCGSATTYLNGVACDDN